MSLVNTSSRRTKRTSLCVRTIDGGHREFLVGDRFSWSFRMHYHAGDEIVHMLAGRALLRTRQTSRIVEAGETAVVPAGTIHRFEAVDRYGWSFASQFVLRCGTQRSAPSIADRSEDLMSRINALLSDRHSLRTDVAQIADAFAISKGYLSRRFRLESGTSLHDFHVVIAVHHAKALLKQGANIVDAALDAGFYDQAHLSREFVRTYGFTPGAFRNAWLSAPSLAHARH